MKIEVFDDWKGTVFHIMLGGFTVYLKELFLIFFAYEFVEHIYLRGKEEDANFLGDVFEFSFGAMLMLLLSNCLLGPVLFLIFVVIIAVFAKRWENELQNNT
ncbi:MAG: hypothetical protein QXV61_00145 [Archaeoglobaceae archaeon]